MIEIKLMDKQIKVAFLCNYPVSTLNINGISDLFPYEHPVPWITNLLFYLKNLYPNIDLHVIVETPRVKNKLYFIKNNIHFHILRSGSAIPFTKFVYPAFLPIDKILLYCVNSLNIINELNVIKPDLVHAHGTEFSYSISAVRSKYKFLISVQGLINLIFKDEKGLFIRLLRYLEILTIKKGKYFIPKTNYVKHYVSQINNSAVFFDIPNIITDIYFNTNVEDNNKKQVVFVGSLQRAKGIEDLIYAISKIAEANLVVVGYSTEGDLRKFINQIYYCLKIPRKTYLQILQKLVSSLNMNKRVEFTGKQNSKEISTIFSCSKLLVLPSYMENGPNVVMEALSAGLPAIAYRVGGLPDIIDDGLNGFLVAPGNIDELTEKIKLLLYDKSLHKRMSQNAKQSAKNKYKSNIVATQTYDAYLRIIRDDSSRETACKHNYPIV